MLHFKDRHPTDVLPPANSRIHMPRFELGDRLTREQIDWLDEYGFIQFKNFASKELVRSLVEEVEQIDRDLVKEGRQIINGVPLIIGTKASGEKYVQRICFASTMGDRLHKFLQDPRFKGILEVAGPGYRIAERERDGLVINHYRNEVGSKYNRLGWHTDSLRDIFYFEKPRRYLNVGFYLDDSPIQKGALRVIPKSHKQSIRSILTHKIHFVDDRYDPEEFVVEAEAGDLTIHDGRIWHRVAMASWTGDQSQRRTMYLPLMEGPEKLKHEGSPTPFYFRLKSLIGY